MVDPATEEQVRQHEGRIEIPDSTPQERLTDEQRQTDGVIEYEQQGRIETTFTPTWLALLMLLLLVLVFLYFPSYLQAIKYRLWSQSSQHFCNVLYSGSAAADLVVSRIMSHEVEIMRHLPVLLSPNVTSHHH